MHTTRVFADLYRASGPGQPRRAVRGMTADGPVCVATALGIERCPYEHMAFHEVTPIDSLFFSE